MSVCQTINTKSQSVCQPHVTSICHTNIMKSLSVCPSYQLSDHHTTTMACPSICQSIQSSGCHTTTKTSPSLCQSHIPSVCHNIIPTSPSVCQSQDSSVCQPICDVTRNTICLTVCSSSVASVLPSANSTVKMPTCIPVQNFLHALSPGKLPFTHTSTDSSIHHNRILAWLTANSTGFWPQNTPIRWD